MERGKVGDTFLTTATKCNKLLFAEGQHIMNTEKPGWLLIAQSANSATCDGKGSDSCAGTLYVGWDDTTA